MIRFRNFLTLAVLMVGAAILGAPTQAHATFQLTIAETGGPSVTITDNGSGDLDGRTGVIVFSGTVGDFDIQTNTGTSNSTTGHPPAKLTINDLSISTAGFDVGTNHTLTITLSDTGFTVPVAGAQASMASQLSTTQLPTDTNVTFQSFLNGNGGTVLTLNTIGGTTASDTVIIPSNPYTLADVTTFTVGGEGAGNSLTVQTTGITAVAVPAPAGVMLALTGLPFLGLGAWLRRWKKA